MKRIVINQCLRLASILLMLTFSIPSKAQVYSTLIKQKLSLKDDLNGDHNTKYTLADNKLILLTRKQSRKMQIGYSANFLSYDINTGIKKQIKLVSDSSIFEYLALDNIKQSIGKDILFVKINEYERLNSDTYSSALYLFKKSGAHTFRQFDVVKDFQKFEGRIYQLDENRVIFYKNYDSNPLDDSMPTITSIYNFSLKAFETINPEKFNGIYITNLVSNFFAINIDKIYKVYPEAKLITVLDFKLNCIDTIKIPILGNYSKQFSTINEIKSLNLPKKEFIGKVKKIDYFIERIESIFILNKEVFCVVIKPKEEADFKKRRLLYYSTLDNKLLNDVSIDYSNSNSNSSENLCPNLTFNAPFILFNEGTNSLVYIVKNQYLKGDKIKGSNRYVLNVLHFDLDIRIRDEKVQTIENDLKLADQLIFSLNGDTIPIAQLFRKRSLVLVQNQRICLPCNSQAYTMIKSQYSRYTKYVLAEYNENLLGLLLYEKQLKKLLKIKKVYYYKDSLNSLNVEGLSNLNIPLTPSPFIIGTNNFSQKFYIPLTDISK